MTVKDFLNKSYQGNFLIGRFMVWKHEQGWSATDIKTKEYFLDARDWDKRKEHVSDATGRNYWRDIEDMLKELEEHL